MAPIIRTKITLDVQTTPYLLAFSETNTLFNHLFPALSKSMMSSIYAYFPPALAYLILASSLVN